MTNGDQILRAFATITALKSNLPNDYELSERWVKEFNDAVGKVANALRTNLDEFKVPESALERSIAAVSYLAEETHYRDGLWCRREVLMHKIDSVLTYFTGLQGGTDKQIGFRRG